MKRAVRERWPHPGAMARMSPSRARRARADAIGGRMDAGAGVRRLVPLILAAIVPAASSAMPPVPPALASFGALVTAEIHDVTFDAAGNLFVSGHEGNAGRVFKITPSGTTSVYLDYQYYSDARGLAFDAA